MAKISFSLHPVAAVIRRAQKQLRSLRAKVSKADQKKIDMNLRALEKSYRLIRIQCHRRRLPEHPPLFGQWFTTNPK
jgi:hypothetical protein